MIIRAWVLACMTVCVHMRMCSFWEVRGLLLLLLLPLPFSLPVDRSFYGTGMDYINICIPSSEHKYHLNAKDGPFIVTSLHCCE